MYGISAWLDDALMCKSSWISKRYITLASNKIVMFAT